MPAAGRGGGRGGCGGGGAVQGERPHMPGYTQLFGRRLRGFNQMMLLDVVEGQFSKS